MYDHAQECIAIDSTVSSRVEPTRGQGSLQNQGQRAQRWHFVEIFVDGGRDLETILVIESNIEPQRGCRNK